LGRVIWFVLDPPTGFSTDVKSLVFFDGYYVKSQKLFLIANMLSECALEKSRNSLRLRGKPSGGEEKIRENA